MEPYTRGFIIVLTAAIFGFLAVWIQSGRLNVEFITNCLSFIFGTYLLISLYCERKKK